jgi:NADPH:quinone reductase-like Zn-dependent oxidoreductase
MEGHGDAEVPETMKAFVCKQRVKSGQAFQLELVNDYPVPKGLANGQLLVKVHATTVNPVDWKVIQSALRYFPAALGGPKFDPHHGTIPCADGSGVVVSSKSDDFPVGTAIVWDNGTRFGSCAEFVVVNASQAVKLSTLKNFREAAGNIGLVSGTAVTGIKWIVEQLRKKRGDNAERLSVVVLGGAGGVGSAAIVYLKSLGHTVYTTCSARNVEWCRRVGADHVIDYTSHSWWEQVPSHEVDAVFQCVSSSADWEGAFDVALKPDGVFTTCDPQKNSIVGTLIRLTFNSRFNMFVNRPSTANLQTSIDVYEKAQAPSIVGHVFPFDRTQEAFDLSCSGKATGKVVIEIIESQ